MTATPTPDSDALTPRARSILGIVFITLFLDLVGFSIIFPLFPAMLEHYLGQEGNAGLLGGVVNALEQFAEWAGAPGEFGIIVLFGGLLGSLYSLLQFLCAPILGSLSDRYGRRPILIVSITGIAVSYAIWCFAGTFLALAVSRIIGGMMSGNISTASAIVADITSHRTRPKGMAIIGMAFGVGFIVGPAMGGLTALIDIRDYWPGGAAYGLNPFSGPAVAAFLLSLINLAFVVLRLPETLPQAASERPPRPVNPVTLFTTGGYPGVRRTNMTNFLFLAAFAGMEFSLTFLAAERLGYTPQQNAYMFLFVGVILAVTQGNYVRAYAGVIGPQRMAVHGFLCTIPGLVLVGLAQHSAVLYGGLFLMAVGSAQVIPCLTALVSLYSPASEQGRSLGVFRSLGALARAVGPLVACILYWRLGSTAAYCVGAALIFAPLFLAATLPPPSASQPGTISP